MRVLEVTTQEQHRIDKLVIRAYGTYNYLKESWIRYMNPRVNFLDLRAGTRLIIPSISDMRKIKKFRGYYDLMRD